MRNEPRDPLAWLSRPIAGRTVPARAVELVRACLDRLVQMQFVDRAVALGSLTFTALVPLMVLANAYMPGATSVADSLIRRFHLTGATADLMRETFADPGTTRGAISVAGVLLLIGSSLSFTRGLQRVFENAWRLQPRGWAGSVAGLKWLAGIVVWVTLFTGVRSWLVDRTGPLVGLIVGLGGSGVLWLFTPYVLLAQRVDWRKLIPTALLTAIGMTALSVASVVYMPDSISESADRYGSIGIAIALVSWLVGAGFVLVACAAVGAVLGGETDEPPRATVSPPAAG